MNSNDDIQMNRAEYNHKVNKTTLHLGELLKAREMKKAKIQSLMCGNNIFDCKQTTSQEQFNPPGFCNKETIPTTNTNEECKPCQILCSSITENISCQKICEYSNIWETYWPFIGSSENNPSLEFDLYYATFNSMLVKKWNTNLPTPSTTFFPNKDLFRLNLVTDKSLFDFDFKFENIPSSGSSTIINICPQSSTYPLNPNQYILIRDPNIVVTNPGTSPTDILAIIGYYHSKELYINQLTSTLDSFDTIKNLFLSTQLFFMHVTHVPYHVRLIVTHNSTLGENLFCVNIGTNAELEIRETLIPTTITPITPNDNTTEIIISQKIIYINGKYFMTYATYINNISGALQLGVVPGYTTDSRQVPLQLAVMLLLGTTAPIVNLETRVGSTDHERAIIRLYNDVLKKILT